MFGWSYMSGMKIRGRQTRDCLYRHSDLLPIGKRSGNTTTFKSSLFHTTTTLVILNEVRDYKVHMFSIQCSNDFTDDKWRVKPGPTLSADQPGYFQFVRIHTFNAKIMTVWFLLRKSRNYWMRPRMKWSNHSVVRIHLTQNSSFYLPTLFHVLPSVSRP